MKGTDVTTEQLAAASAFLEGRGWPEQMPAARMSREQAVRLVAWYGALRYKAGASGVASLECPGPVGERLPASDNGADASPSSAP
jgi:hypothetical protein